MANLIIWFKDGKEKSFKGVKNFNSGDSFIQFKYITSSGCGWDVKFRWEHVKGYAITKKYIPKMTPPVSHRSISKLNAPVSLRLPTSSVPLNPWA
ncbi:MAG: hypothetical protein [Bacteriophage sp.]|nr:MAG: hypothetical protein [Bacteriophage sp.]